MSRTRFQDFSVSLRWLVPVVASAALAGCGGNEDTTLADTGTTSSKAVVGKTLYPANRGYSLTSNEFRHLYGPGVFKMDALANTVVGVNGNYEQKVVNRFRATVSGTLQSVRIYWQTGKGYSAGNGGVIQLRLLPDDGSAQHLPNLSAKPLATARYIPGQQVSSSGAPVFTDIHFSSTQPIQAGQLYHLVMENLDPSPKANFISSNNGITVTANGRPARWTNTTDWATLLGTRPYGTTRALRWFDLTTNGASNNYYLPILQLNVSGGQVQGVANIEGGALDPKLIFTSTNNRPIREHFKPTATKRVSGLSFATAASVAGNLRWRILQGNTELASGQVHAPSPNYRAITTNSGNKVGSYSWYDVNLPHVVTLQAGQEYDIEFRPQGNSQWKFGDQRNGSAKGFARPAAFTESRAQHFQGNRWLNTYHWNYNAPGGSDANWPVVLHLAP